MKKLPNFLIVGAAKSGTTSLHYYLQQHPEVFLPTTIKETFFFSQPQSVLGKGPGRDGADMITNKDDYVQLYADATSSHKALGEACVAYLHFHEESIPNIQKLLSKPKILIILRNPVDRAYSNYLHHARDDFEPLTVEEALEAESERLKKKWWWGYQFTDAGLYSDQVAAYLQNFDDVKICLFEDFKKDVDGFLRETFKFLGVDSSFQADTSLRYNVTGVPKSKLVRDVIKQPPPFLKKIIRTLLPDKFIDKMKSKVKQKNVTKSVMNPQTRKKLQDFYRKDIKKLEILISRDISHWYT